MRARGESTSNLAEPQQNPGRQSRYANAYSAAKDIASLFKLTDNVSLDHIGSYIEKLVAIQGIITEPSYKFSKLCPLTEDELGSRETLNPGDNEETGCESKKTEARGVKSNLQENPTAPAIRTPTPECLLCQKPWTYGTPLSQHYRRVHQKTLSRPFSCPECQDHIVNGWNEWISNIASRHGRHNAPRPRSRTQSPQGPLTCLLCGNLFVTLGGLSKHTTKSHGKHFESPRPCPVCFNSEDKAPVVSSLSEWCRHVELSHGGTQCAPKVLLDMKIRCFLCSEDVVHERNHYIKHHLGAFHELFPCPECTRQGVETPSHGKTTRIFGQSQLSRCLVCDRFYSKVADHFTKDHMRLFPFQCQECERLKETLGCSGVLIKDRDEWVLHCAAAHGDIASALSAQTVAAQLRTKRKREDDPMWAKKVKRESGSNSDSTY